MVPSVSACGTSGDTCTDCGTRADACSNGACTCGGGTPCRAGQVCQGGACVCDPASQACGGVVFAISPNQPNGSNVVNWPGSAWTVSGTIHSNSDVAISGTGNVINGVIEHVTGFTISPDNTLNPSTNNPVKSTVLPDPVNKTPADFYQGTASTATYHYINGNTSLSSYVTNGVLQSGIYYVNGNIDFFTTMSQTVRGFSAS